MRRRPAFDREAALFVAAGVSVIGNSEGRAATERRALPRFPPPDQPTTLSGTETGGGPLRTRLLCLGSYPVTFGDRCDSTATCLVTFLRTTLTPLTPLFVVTV